jgi:heat shock protein HspQ
MSAKRTTGGSRAGKSKRAGGRTAKAPDLIAAPSLKKKAAKIAAKSPGKVKTNVKPVKVRAQRAVTAKPAEVPRRRNRRKSTPKSARSDVTSARFAVGDVVRHKIYPFRGVIFDIDPVFANTEEWWLSIPENMRPKKNQPYYHLLAENAETEYIAYVSEQNLVQDTTGAPVRHPQVSEYFIEDDEGRYRPVFMTMLN